ncbi:hypothetical protein [Fodinicola feengrottensis]|uniref:Uncharacterized protein n=1 Tax=Fodinicola feengrottensis TaxID=435914 RepID=A0ABP4UBL3_9ACTN|nr:hypothetical protein [Fodinicola feengrottensis]
MTASRLRTLDVDLWQRLHASSETIQRHVVATLIHMVMDEAPVTSGREQVETALAAGAFGDSELRTWLQQTADAVAAASYEADELDHDQVEARRLTRQMTGYKAAYLALDVDPAKAAGEVAYEAMVLLGQSPTGHTIQQLLNVN